MKDFTEKLRDRLQGQAENERWTLLMRQRKLVADYEQVVEQLRNSDAQIQRLLGPLPSKDICLECYYRSGSSVGLRLLNEGNRAGDGVLTCPGCELVLTS